jgi:hypothetical protein
MGFNSAFKGLKFQYCSYIIIIIIIIIIIYVENGGGAFLQDILFDLRGYRMALLTENRSWHVQV